MCIMLVWTGMACCLVVKKIMPRLEVAHSSLSITLLRSWVCLRLLHPWTPLERELRGPAQSCDVLMTEKIKRAQRWSLSNPRFRSPHPSHLHALAFQIPRSEEEKSE